MGCEKERYSLKGESRKRFRKIKEKIKEKTKKGRTVQNAGQSSLFGPFRSISKSANRLLISEAACLVRERTALITS